MKSGIIASIIMIVFFSSLAVFVTLSKRPICIDSRVVERIDRLSSEGMKTVWRCSSGRSVPYDEKFQRYLPEISRQLSAVERFFDEAGPLSLPVRVTWLDGMSETIRIQGTQIFISQKLLLSTDQLQRAIVRIWLREKSGEVSIDRTLLEGGLVDLIMYSLGHAPDFSQVNRKWPNLLTSASGVCQKLFTSSDLYLMCGNYRNFETNDPQSLLVGSGRAVLSESLISSYMKLNLKNRSLLFHSLSTALSNMDHFTASSLMSEESTVKDTEPLHADLEKIEKIISSFSASAMTGQLSWKIFEQELQGQMNIHGFSSHEFVAQLDDLIQLGPDIDLNSTVIDYFARLKDSKLLVGVANEEQVLMLPGSTPLQKKIFGLMKAHQLMYLSCEMPSVEKLSELSKISNQLLYVKACGSVTEVNFQEYLSKGYVGFAQSNPQMSFVQMHLPSLLQAGNGHFGNPLPALAREDWQNPFFTKVGWQTPTWDNSIGIYRTKSVIQAIEAYRP